MLLQVLQRQLIVQVQLLITPIDTTDTTADTTDATDDTSASTTTAEQAATQTILGMNSQQLQQLFASASGVAYANMRLTAAQDTRKQAEDFGCVATGRYLTTDEQTYAYVDFGGRNNAWKNSDTVLKGYYNLYGTTAGFYTQRAGWNFGAAAHVSRAD
ncbi:hypothetical protein [Psittacicella hinzii]|uniref:Uncharacterized protein n=1 Tax=Psittacicella hinzii TaxID=2028575 RepID=A0A3A1YUI0_9GAMM|nr:hypothetical protein [Psittacicella hinzii]RIY39727.1 hypothetical protein CKF58_01630 [Psittacicella hinzii]